MGIEAGKAEGVLEGESKAKLDAARMMKNANVSVLDIIKFTGLKKEDIEIL